MFRIAKREKSSLSDSILYRLFGFVFGIVLSMLFIFALGHNPFQSIIALLSGSFGTANAIRNTLTFAIPLATTALGLSIAFRMKFWNIGGEGQLLMGATAAMFVSLQSGPNTPGWLLILLMFVAGFLGGAIWAMIPGIFRIQLRTNETLFTLMMNYLAIAFVKYLYYNLWKDPDRGGFPGIKSIQTQAFLPRVVGVSLGVLVPIIVMVIVYILVNKTKPGYEIRVVGESEPTAHYAGMNVKKIMLGGVLLSGGIVGLAGAVKLTGETFTLTESLAGGAGFTAIVIAWLANLSAPIILAVSFSFAALEQGAQSIQLRLGVPAAVAEIIKGLMLMSFLGSEFFLRYRMIFSRREKQLPEAFESVEAAGGADHIIDEKTEVE
ncbi:MAG: ABC transporter permease [Clostridiales bacterium]|nr:ABC transporter permease [Clostridiales bacterium]